MDDTPEFDIFWLEYPLKKGKSKAEEYWQRLKPDLSEVMAALEMQKQEREWLKNKKRFVPEWKHGSTWVSQKSWRDGYDEDFEKYIKDVQERPENERRALEKRKQEIRDSYSSYYEERTREELEGFLTGNNKHTCFRWLIREIMNGTSKQLKEKQ